MLVVLGYKPAVLALNNRALAQPYVNIWTVGGGEVAKYELLFTIGVYDQINLAACLVLVGDESTLAVLRGVFCHHLIRTLHGITGRWSGLGRALGRDRSRKLVFDLLVNEEQPRFENKKCYSDDHNEHCGDDRNLFPAHLESFCGHESIFLCEVVAVALKWLTAGLYSVLRNVKPPRIEV